MSTLMSPGPADTQKRWELTRWSAVRTLLRQRALNWIVMTVAFFGFLLAIAAGILGTAAGSANFGIVFVWIVWWGLLMGALLPLGGRLWCFICPIPAPGEWLQRKAIVDPPGNGRAAGLLSIAPPERAIGTSVEAVAGVALAQGASRDLAAKPGLPGRCAVQHDDPHPTVGDGVGPPRIPGRRRGAGHALRAQILLPIRVPGWRLHRVVFARSPSRVARARSPRLPGASDKGLLSRERRWLRLSLAGATVDDGSKCLLRPLRGVPADLHEG